MTTPEIMLVLILLNTVTGERVEDVVPLGPDASMHICRIFNQQIAAVHMRHYSSDWTVERLTCTTRDRLSRGT